MWSTLPPSTSQDDIEQSAETLSAMIEGDLGLVAIPNAFGSPPTIPLKPALQKPSRRLSVMRRSSSADQILQSTHHSSPPLLKHSIAFPTTPLDQTRAESLSKWIHGFAVVNFDLETGPDLDSMYPLIALSPLDRANVAFASMPETASLQPEGTRFTHFSWRLPRDPATERAEGHFLLGFVCFMRQKNPKAVRGFVQRSLILITELIDCIGLFATLMSILGPAYMRNESEGSAIIEAACSNIAKWPPPVPGSLAELPFLGHLFTVDMPLQGQAQTRDSRTLRTPAGLKPVILACCPLTPLTMLFTGMVSRLWLLWELLITAEPIVVYAPGDASKVSEIVTWLITIIRPLSYGGDWRPLFTLQQSEHGDVLRHIDPSSGILLGVTSPLIFSNCHSFPHVLRASFTQADKASPASAASAGLAKKIPTRSFQEAQEALSGLFSERKRVVHRDSDVLKAVEARIKCGEYLAADAVLVRHFTDMTERLLVPLNRYFATIQPQSSPGVAAISRSPLFNKPEFIDSLKTYDSPLRLRRGPIGRSPGLHNQVVNLYERFCQGVHFDVWLRGRIEASVKAESERAGLTRRFEGQMHLSPNGKPIGDGGLRSPRSRSMDVGRPCAGDRSLIYDGARYLAPSSGLSKAQRINLG